MTVETTTDIAALVAESRAEQGLPPTLEDEVALDQIASLVVLNETPANKRGAKQ